MFGEKCAGAVIADRRLFVTQRIAGGDVFEFRRCDDFTGHGFFHGFLLLALEAKQVAHFFLHLPARHVASHVRSDFPRHDPHDRKLAGERIDHGFEHVGRKRSVGIGGALDRFAIGGVDPLRFALIERRWQIVDDGIEQLRDADLA